MLKLLLRTLVLGLFATVLVACSGSDGGSGGADTGSDGTGSDGTGSDGTGSDGTGGDGTGGDGTGTATFCEPNGVDGFARKSTDVCSRIATIFVSESAEDGSTQGGAVFFESDDSRLNDYTSYALDTLNRSGDFCSVASADDPIETDIDIPESPFANILDFRTLDGGTPIVIGADGGTTVLQLDQSVNQGLNNQTFYVYQGMGGSIPGGVYTVNVPGGTDVSAATFPMQIVDSLDLPPILSIDQFNSPFTWTRGAAIAGNTDQVINSRVFLNIVTIDGNGVRKEFDCSLVDDGQYDHDFASQVDSNYTVQSFMASREITTFRQVGNVLYVQVSIYIK